MKGMCNVIAVYLILTEFAQCHVRDHLEDGTPESGLVPSAVDTDTMRGKGNLPEVDVTSLLGEAQAVLLLTNRSLIFH